MKQIVTVVALAAALGACGGVRQGNEAGGLVVARSDALARADEHCRAFGKVARISGAPMNGRLSFDCVAP